MCHRTLAAFFPVGYANPAVADDHDCFLPLLAAGLPDTSPAAQGNAAAIGTAGGCIGRAHDPGMVLIV